MADDGGRLIDTSKLPAELLAAARRVGRGGVLPKLNVVPMRPLKRDGKCTRCNEPLRTSRCPCKRFEVRFDGEPSNCGREQWALTADLAVEIWSANHFERFMMHSLERVVVADERGDEFRFAVSLVEYTIQVRMSVVPA